MHYAGLRPFESFAILGSLFLLLSGCELGVDQSTLVKPNYDLLAPCGRPEQAQATSIVLESLCGTISVYEDRASNTLSPYTHLTLPTTPYV